MVFAHHYLPTRLAAGAAVAVLCAGAVAAPAHAADDVIALETPAGYAGSQAQDINDRGAMVGNVWTADMNYRAVRWNPVGQPSVLPLLPGGTTSFVFSVNERGTAVGWSNGGADPQMSPVRWNAAGEATEMAVLPGSSGTTALDLNDRGVITGSTRTAAGRHRAIRWAANGSVSELAVPADVTNTWPIGIADDGSVAGGAETTGGETHVVRWDAEGRFTDIGAAWGATSSFARAVNDRGSIAVDIGGGLGQSSVRWDPRGAAVPLTVPPGGTHIQAWGISGHGVVVGQTADAFGAWRAARWDRRGAVTTLSGTNAIAVNNHSVAVGDSSGRATCWDRAGDAAELGRVPGTASSYPVGLNNRGTAIGNAYTDAGQVQAVAWRGVCH